MKLQIRELFMVRRGTLETKRYEFRPGMLNIVTGQGARGKSTVWSVIDYVCCANECDIDSRICEVLDWVGLEIETGQGVYTLAREIRLGKNAASPVYFMRHHAPGDGKVDGIDVRGNTNLASVKGLLNRICGIEALGDVEGEKNTRLPLSIRHLLNIVGQDYNTIADSKHLFAFKAVQQTLALSRYFESIIGIDARRLNFLREEKLSDTRTLEKMEGEYRRALDFSDLWRRDLRTHLVEAKKLTLIPPDKEIPASVEKCVALLRETVENARNKPSGSANLDMLGGLAERVADLIEKRSGLELELLQLQVRLEELHEMDRKAGALRANAQKSKDRLELGEWLMRNWDEYEPSLFGYPGSDGRDADDVRREIAAIGNALRKYEQSTLDRDRVLEFRNMNEAELKRLSSRQDVLRRQLKDIVVEIDTLKSKGAMERAQIESHEDLSSRISRFTGRCETMLSLLDAIADTSDLSLQIERLREKVRVDAANVNIEKLKVDSEFQDALDRLSERSLEVAKSVGLTGDFVAFANMKFDVAKLDFLIIRGDSETYLKRRKSTGNHVSFHVGVTVAMQETCATSEWSLLPEFVVYDQPSQGHGGYADDGNVGERYFASIAKVLSDSVRRTGGAWQPILIDSWGRDALRRLDGVDYWPVADLDEANGLVPAEWMERRQ